MDGSPQFQWMQLVVTNYLVSQNKNCVNMSHDVGSRAIPERDGKIFHNDWCCYHDCLLINSSPTPEQNGRHLPDDVFKRIFVNENVKIVIRISLTLVSYLQYVSLDSGNGLVQNRRPWSNRDIWERQFILFSYIYQRLCISATAITGLNDKA